MPFIDVVTGWEVVEYMATEDDTAAGSSGEEEDGMRLSDCRRSSLAGGGQQRTAGGGRRKRSLQLERLGEWTDGTDGTGLDWTGNGALGCRMQLRPGKARMIEEKLRPLFPDSLP